MAHCPPKVLEDLAQVLEQIRALPGVVEKSPGVFYVGRDPFLHFHHAKDGRLRADVKGAGEWQEVELSLPATGRQRQTLLRSAWARHAEKPLPKVRRR